MAYFGVHKFNLENVHFLREDIWSPCNNFFQIVVIGFKNIVGNRDNVLITAYRFKNMLSLNSNSTHLIYKR